MTEQETPQDTTGGWVLWSLAADEPTAPGVVYTTHNEAEQAALRLFGSAAGREYEARPASAVTARLAGLVADAEAAAAVALDALEDNDPDDEATSALRSAFAALNEARGLLS